MNDKQLDAILKYLNEDDSSLLEGLFGSRTFKDIFLILPKGVMQSFLSNNRVNKFGTVNQGDMINFSINSNKLNEYLSIDGAILRQLNQSFSVSVGKNNEYLIPNKYKSHFDRREYYLISLENFTGGRPDKNGYINGAGKLKFIKKDASLNELCNSAGINIRFTSVVNPNYDAVLMV